MPTKAVTVTRRHGVVEYQCSDLDALVASAKARGIAISSALEERIQREGKAKRRRRKREPCGAS